MSSWEAAVRHLGPVVVRGPDDVASILRAVFGIHACNRQVVLAIGTERMLAGFAARDPKCSSGPFVASHVVDIALDADAPAVVVVTLDGGASVPGGQERAVYEQMRRECERCGVIVLDWLIVAGHRWWSLREMFGPRQSFTPATN